MANMFSPQQVRTFRGYVEMLNTPVPEAYFARFPDQNRKHLESVWYNQLRDRACRGLSQGVPWRKDYVAGPDVPGRGTRKKCSLPEAPMAPDYLDEMCAERGIRFARPYLQLWDTGEAETLEKATKLLHTRYDKKLNELQNKLQAAMRDKNNG